jgi:hypothetical protein
VHRCLTVRESPPTANRRSKRRRDGHWGRHSAFGGIAIYIRREVRGRCSALGLASPSNSLQVRGGTGSLAGGTVCRRHCQVARLATKQGALPEVAGHYGLGLGEGQRNLQKGWPWVHFETNIIIVNLEVAEQL